MTVSDNAVLARNIEDILTEKLPIDLGVNKKNELIRLVYEISLRDSVAPENILNNMGIEELLEEGRGELFHRVKERLLKARYPSMKKGDDPHLVPLNIDEKDTECISWDESISPRRIFIEKDVRDLDWTGAFLENFPEAERMEIKDVREGADRLSFKDEVEKYDARRENIFLVRNKSSFIKVCPCTKGYKRCGYWILNIGFGCPMDCSYCYLRMYSNTPGIILPANIEDYYGPVMEMDERAGGRKRIGTGEFTDSLALDKYTKYSSYLIPLFAKTRNLVLELKTKAADITGVLDVEPNDNVVISWSVNTEKMAERYERGGSKMSDRIRAAEEAAGRGYKIGFHFDPVVWYPGWEEDYKNIVDDIFSRDIIRDNTLWISLGTLRYTPAFKQVAERRFSDNFMFYQAEFFEDTDGKMRYPRPQRISMYNKMIEWIRESGTGAWIYLCMEPEEVWGETSLKESVYKQG